MNKKSKYRELTLLEFQKKFSTERKCREYLAHRRWPDGFVCPQCGGRNSCFNPSRSRYECYGCHKVTSLTSGTIFHKTRVPLKKWFWCIYLLATSKKGVSALYLQKQLSIGAYRTAWLMTQKVRQAMRDRDEFYKISGIVQADEIFIGGLQSRKNRLKNQAESNKSPFFIAVEETAKGKPRFVAIEKLKGTFVEEILPKIEKKIERGSVLKSDGAIVYRHHVEAQGYKSERVVVRNEPEKAYEHLKWTNMLTSNLKRFILSTHHGVFPRYRQAYVGEFAYRFNRRFWPGQAFDRLLLANVTAKPSPKLTLCA